MTFNAPGEQVGRNQPLQAHSSFDLNQMLDEGRWNGFQKCLLVLAALAFAVDGLANQVLGLALPSLIRDWGAPREAFAPVAALGLIGVAVGTVAGGVLGDRFGRRSGLIGSVLLFGIMTTASAGAHGLNELTWLRFAAGLGIGGAIPSGAALITEFTPARHRSFAIAAGMVFIPIGGVLAGAIGTYALPLWGWRGMFLISGTLPLILGVLFLALLPESPRYLARRPGRHAQLVRLLGRCGLTVDGASTFAGEQEQRRHAPLAALLGKRMRTDTLALWTAFFFCLLASYSMFSWVPTMLMGQGFTLRSTSIGMTAFNIGGMTGGVSGGWLIGRFGSRAAVLGVAAGATLGAIALGLLPIDPLHGFSLALGALVIEGFFVGGLNNGMYTLAAFLYPPFVRATGVGTASAVGRIGAVLSSFTGVLTLRLGGSSGYFIVIAVATGIAFIATSLIRGQIPRCAADVSELRKARSPSC
jgi:MFS transporter, AAHS family, 4-hydroxybenzoate transporter